MARFDHLPQPLPRQAADSVLGGVACSLRGPGPATTLASTLAATLEAGQAVLVDADAVLWKEASVTWRADGSDIVAAGPGRIGFGGCAGMIFPIPLGPGERVELLAGRFLFGVGVTLARELVQDLADRIAGRAGVGLHRFTAGDDGGVVWVQAQGDVFEHWLRGGEPFDLRPQAWLCKDPGVALRMVAPDDDQAAIGPGWLRLTGPGRIAFQTGAAAPVAVVVSPEAARPAPGMLEGMRGVAGSLLARLG